VRTQVVYLYQSCDFAPAAVSDLEIESARASIKSYVEHEHAKLVQVDVRNGKPVLWANQTEFPAQTETIRCRRCNYRGICAEGKARIQFSAADDEPTVSLPALGTQRDEVHAIKAGAPDGSPRPTAAK
jgi:hypothetical protein